MNSMMTFGRWIVSGLWYPRRPESSSLTWGRLAVSWVLSTLLVSLLFVLLAAGGFLNGVTVALLWVPAQAAILLGLLYAARRPAGTS